MSSTSAARVMHQEHFAVDIDGQERDVVFLYARKAREFVMDYLINELLNDLADGSIDADITSVVREFREALNGIRRFEIPIYNRGDTFFTVINYVGNNVYEIFIFVLKSVKIVANKKSFWLVSGIAVAAGGAVASVSNPVGWVVMAAGLVMVVFRKSISQISPDEFREIVGPVLARHNIVMREEVPVPREIRQLCIGTV
jgi:hypothetical protein